MPGRFESDVLSVPLPHRILVTGALGQIGSELVPALRERYGGQNVVATDVRAAPKQTANDGPFELLDCTDPKRLFDTVTKHEIGTIYHLAALLSSVAEERPHAAWDLNMGGLYNVLEVAREQYCSVFHPSSIGSFGPKTPVANTPQDTIQRPTTMYGVTKVAGELLCDYYHAKYGVDTRGVRYPGLISHVTLPGGGTTDYAVEIFYEAVEKKRYTCRLGESSRLDMMYMPDAINAAVKLMEADSARLKHRNAFNITAINFTPAELAAEIQKHVPEFEVDYDVDTVLQGIADSWPDSIDDSSAREEWDWAPEYDLRAMTEDMLKNLRARLGGDP